MNDLLAAPLARILLRYAGGALVAKGVLVDSASLADPDTVQVVTLLLGVALSAISESWYALAHKRNWRR